MNWTPFDRLAMQQALFAAKGGEGFVEPNPMVGCVIARDQQILATGWHRAFGGPHAEIEALSTLKATGQPTGHSSRGCTAYVTLEPCCHHGKTPPCTTALIDAGVTRVVMAMQDPFPKVAGGGKLALEAAGIQVDVGLFAEEAIALNAPYLTRVCLERPYIIAKWAMTLDGKIASASGHSQWITSSGSRERVQELRSKVDYVAVGVGTVLADDPKLTLRLSDPPRHPGRLVFDDRGQTPLESVLVTTARENKTLIVVGPQADAKKVAGFKAAGCEVIQTLAVDRAAAVKEVFAKLSKEGVTKILVEGGGGLLGLLFDQGYIDEVHAFVAAKLVGGQKATTPIGGIGLASMPQTASLTAPEFRLIENDLEICGQMAENAGVLRAHCLPTGSDK